jgi:uncharacterized RDD family membrane protein YckC
MDEPGDPLPARVLGRGARGAGRIVGATGVNRALDAAAEEALVRAIESPALERALARLAEEGRLQEVIERTVARVEVEAMVGQALDSDASDRIWREILASDKAQMLVERVAEAPEVRAAIAQQGLGLLGDVGRNVSRITGAFDEVLERLAARLLRRPRVEPATPEPAGLVTRLVAMGLDLALMVGVLSLFSGLLASIVPVAFGTPEEGVSALVLLAAGAVWFGIVGAYLVTFWTLAGQTPGMRFLGLRLLADGSPGVSLPVALRRLAAIPLAVLPLGAGFLTILVPPRRRGLHDRLAGTNVVRDESAAPWSVVASPSPGGERHESG